MFKYEYDFYASNEVYNNIISLLRQALVHSHSSGTWTKGYQGYKITVVKAESDHKTIIILEDLSVKEGAK